MIINLLIKPVEKLAPCQTFKNKEDLRGGFVNLLKPNNVGVVQLDENLNFLAKLLQRRGAVDMTEIEAFDRISNASLPMLALFFV